MFSLGEMLVLGGPPADLDLGPWGMAAVASSGCLCTEMLPPARWVTLMGRSQVGGLVAAVPDINLHIARTLKELALPARLAKYVLSAAVQDFADDVRPTDADDWLTLVRTARSIPRSRR